MPQVIFETKDWSTMVFLFTNIDEPNHNGKAMTRAALREFIARQPVDSCVEPIEVHWNKSDTHTYCVVACSRERVGVDIEYMRERPFEKISRRYLTLQRLLMIWRYSLTSGVRKKHTLNGRRRRLQIT